MDTDSPSRMNGNMRLRPARATNMQGQIISMRLGGMARGGKRDLLIL